MRKSFTGQSKEELFAILEAAMKLEFGRVVINFHDSGWEAIVYLDQQSQNGSASSNSEYKLVVARAVREAIQGAEEEFTTSEIIENIKERYPGTSVSASGVSSALYRICRGGHIETVKKGRGSEPNIWRKT